MRILELVQGSKEWQEFRLTRYGASEAASVLGLSTKMSRSELMYMKSLGVSKEFSDYVQRFILDKGHEVEALARPIAEKVLGQRLYPVTCDRGDMVLATAQGYQLQSASCDGMTLDDETTWEHKQFNKDLFASIESGVLPDEYMPQCQQNLDITGAKRLMFTCSDGTEENFAWMWVYPDSDYQARIRGAWDIFHEERKAYVPMELVAKPEAVAIEQLPELQFEVRGEVIGSNVVEYKTQALAFIGSINTDLQTDQDFADAENTVKFCEEVEGKLKRAMESVLSQTASIDELHKTYAFLLDSISKKRIELKSLIKTKKDAIKNDIIKKAQEQFSEYLIELEKGIEPIRINMPAPNFAEAMKGKKSTKTVMDAVNQALANGKVEATGRKNLIAENLAFFECEAGNHKDLFNDLQFIVGKSAEDFIATVKLRVADHLTKLEKQKIEQGAASASVLPSAVHSVVTSIASAPSAKVELAKASDGNSVERFISSLTWGSQAEREQAAQLIYAYLNFEASNQKVA